MATAIELITDALRTARIISHNQTPTAQESNDSLRMLNYMLDQWSTQALSVYRIEPQTFAWAAGLVSRTIGPTGNFVTNRPIKLGLGSYVTLNGETFPLDTIPNNEEYSLIGNKTQSGVPARIWYDPTYPNGTLYLWPVPDQAYPLTLNSYQRLLSVPTLATDVTLPPAYEMAVIFQLALKMAPQFGVAIRPETLQQAREALGAVKRVNLQPAILHSDPMICGGGYGGFGGWRGGYP